MSRTDEFLKKIWPKLNKRDPVMLEYVNKILWPNYLLNMADFVA